MAKKSAPRTRARKPAAKKPPVTTDGTQPPPAYFLSLTVENVRCFKGPETLDLSDGNGRPAQWTILLGDNGTGKTTLLQCLTKFRPREESSEDRPFRSLFNFSQRRSYAGVRRFLPREIGNDLHRSDEPACGVAIQLGFDNVISDTKGVFRRSSSAIVEIISEERITEELPHQIVEFSKRYESLYEFEDAFDGDGLICYSYGASRRLGGKGLGDNFSHPDSCASLFDDEAALTNAEEWLLQADYAALKSPGSDAQRRFDIVKDVLISVLLGVKDIKAIPPPGFGQPAHVEVLHEGVRVPLRSLSSGYRSVLVWMVDLATRMLERYPDEEKPLEQPAIVLVDQIDLHLHPKWQRELIGRLSELFPNTQFIVTAHSPLIVQAGADVGANVAVLRRVGDHVVIDQRLESVRGWSADQVLLSGMFELPGVHGPEADTWMAERRAILSKSRLTKADDTRLAELDAKLDTLPIGETPADRRAADLIRRAAAEIEQAKKPARRRAAVKA